MKNNSQKGGVGVWLIIIVVIAAGAYYFFSRSGVNLCWPYCPGMTDQDREEIKKSALEAKTSAIPIETIVTYNANGFSPNTVTVKKGGMVVFQNKTGKVASIASDDHPTHTKYPEFDQYKTEHRGQNEFRFTFDKVGTWGYHDHLNTNMTGTVIVTE